MCGGKIDDSHRYLWLTFCFSAVKKLTEIGGLVAYLCPDILRTVNNISLCSFAQKDGQIKFC